MRIPALERLLSIVGLAVFVILSVTGCGGGDDDSKKDSSLRVLNVSTGYSSIDLYANKNYSANAGEADKLRIEATAYETMSSYASIESDNYNIKFKRNGSTGTLLTESAVSLGEEAHSTFVTYGATGSFGAVKIGEDTDAPDSGKSKVNVLNTGETDAMDVYLTDQDESKASSPVPGYAWRTSNCP